jgi:DNA helicase-2/ATP-dependent DNA helicase PcrA
MSKYTEEQLKFINYNGNDSVILSATAGSGKTHSTVGRLNKMIEDGVDPSRIIFFSFTNDAVNELRSRIKHDVKITTIHSFTSSILGKMGLFKPIVTFYEFTNWYKDKYKPHPKDPMKIKMDYARNVDRFYEEGAQISAGFSAYKLQNADNIKVMKPSFYDEYSAFIKETKSRDFSDMLIDTEKYSRNAKYKGYFENLYDYIFVDEYQDTSTLQMKILLAIKAKQYHLIGDKNKSIYGFSGANCEEIENLLMKNSTVTQMTLTKNFRSTKKIVENSNRYSSLVAVPHHEEDGYIHDNLINDVMMYNMMNDGKPLTVLARTNNVIKEIEKECLKKKIKMRYFNFISPQDIEKINEGKVNPSLKKKIDSVSPYYGNTFNLINFIKENQESDVFVTSIHKSKGREFPRCIIINSIDPDMLAETDYDFEEYSFLTNSGEINQEAKNVHYVAVTRPKEELYFLVYEN